MQAVATEVEKAVQHRTGSGEPCLADAPYCSNRTHRPLALLARQAVWLTCGEEQTSIWPHIVVKPSKTWPLQALAKEAEEAAQRKAGSSQARLDLEAQMLEKIDLQRKQQVTFPFSGCKQSEKGTQGS